MHWKGSTVLCSCFQKILEYRIRIKRSEATKKDNDNLVLDIFPSVLEVKQKENKGRNILYAMSKKDKTIINIGTNRYPIWILSLSKNENAR